MTGILCRCGLTVIRLCVHRLTVVGLTVRRLSVHRLTVGRLAVIGLTIRRLTVHVHIVLSVGLLARTNNKSDKAEPKAPGKTVIQLIRITLALNDIAADKSQYYCNYQAYYGGNDIDHRELSFNCFFDSKHTLSSPFRDWILTVLLYIIPL